MSTDDASATYRGYRRQSLYALFRLFDDGLPEGYVVQPEGTEDLAIYDLAGALVEIVQVKDFSDNLAASSFKPSFYQRISPFCKPDSSTKVTIVSYGPIGPDLKDALSGDQNAQSRVVHTLTKDRILKPKAADGIVQKIPGLPEAEARNIINHIEVTSADEEVLTSAILTALSKTITGVNAVQAFEFLMWWLLTSSEGKLRIDRGKAVAKIENIGRFLSERAAYHDEWHTTIIPMVAVSASTVRDGSLAEEFYKGGRVRFDHVNLDLDVPRDRFLKRVHDSFDVHNVVVIHSASGQGKTTLAYRYAKEFAASDFRLEVRASSDLKHARRVALALTGHAAAIEVPTLIFLDVRPGDNCWVEVVRELSSVAGIRVLVSIREEDWTSARITLADFSFAEIELSLEKSEAEAIYNRLVSMISRSRYLDFEEAWNKFGDRKTLFEFVYYVTQEESLVQRIFSQVDALQDAVIRGERDKSEIELLRLVSVASAYEARLNLEKLLDYCELSAPQRTIALFNNEYLIRVTEDGCNIEGYHSIRSEIIAGKLTDRVVYPWTRAASRTLPLIVEDDLHTFLLCAFSRNPSSSKSLIAALDGFRPRTWVGVQGVSTSLMWDGLKNYSEQNSALLDEVFQQFNSGWYFALDWDLAQVTGSEGSIKFFEALEDVTPGVTEYVLSARGRQTNKETVFSDMRNWLEGCTELPRDPTNIRNFQAMGEVLFWLGHLQINSCLRAAISGEVIEKAHKELPLYLFGEFIHGLRVCAREAYDEWLNTRLQDFVEYVRQESAIVSLDETEESLVAHYAIDLDRQSSVLRSHGDFLSPAEVTIHQLTMERVELLSNLFPGKKRYGAVGYGHRMVLVKQPWDDANKPGVLAENLHVRWLTRLNALAIGYVELRYRTENWTEYFEVLQSTREKVLAAFRDLRLSITKPNDFSASPGPISLQSATDWDDCHRQIKRSLLLPLAAVDEWGFITESSIANAADSRIQRYSGSTRFGALSQAVAEYSRTVGNFMSQAHDCLLLVPCLRANISTQAKDALIAALVNFRISESAVRLSIVNGFDACTAIEELQSATRMVFGNGQVPGADWKFCERERNEFIATIAAWRVFIDSDQRTHRTRKLKNRSRSEKQKGVAGATLSGLLTWTRRRVKRALKAVRKQGITAYLLSEEVLWKGRPALWIVYDTIHPIASLHALEVIWHQLIAAFAPDRQKIVRSKAMDLLWTSIIVVPLVCGKSLERHGMPHFKAVTYPEPPSLQQNPGYLFPENIPEDLWLQLKIDHWEVQPSWDLFDRFVSAYSSLIVHIEHMSDFIRLPDDCDELGVSILQSYLDHETIRAQPLMQEVFDSCAAVLEKFSEFDASRPNMYLCMQLLIEIRDTLMPKQDFDGKCKLTIEEICNWRDRLVAGMQQIGFARYLWIADSLQFDALPAWTP